MQQKSKREVLREKVVDLVKEFVKTENGITGADLDVLFGPPVYSELAKSLRDLKVFFAL